MFKSILVPIDLAQPSSWEGPLPLAAEFARNHGAKLHVLNVVPPFGMAIVGGFFPEDFERRAIEEAKKALADTVAGVDLGGVEAHLLVSHGTIYEEILHAADEMKADLIVMMAHRPELRDYLLGPNAARVVRHAKQSVFVMRTGE